MSADQDTLLKFLLGGWPPNTSHSFLPCPQSAGSFVISHYSGEHIYHPDQDWCDQNADLPSRGLAPFLAMASNPVAQQLAQVNTGLLALFPIHTGTFSLHPRGLRTKLNAFWLNVQLFRILQKSTYSIFVHVRSFLRV